eukprot:4909788-Ditylum_brightwellii.AAC.1
MVHKHKAQLSVHGGQQKYGINYVDTYAPMVTWPSIRMTLILSLLYSWHTQEVDFIMAYPQANIETNLYMKLPPGIEVDCDDGQVYVLRLLKNLYGQK